jgi:CheY-like chemotaxis protein
MKKILIIDDELSLRELLKKKFTSTYEVFIAEDGKKGLEIIEKQRPDLVICDINMPVMSGLEMLAELRKTEFGKTVKIIMLTNLAPSPDIIKQTATDKPVSYFIKVNTNLGDLKKKVDELLAK